jgi:hypothetical protein
MGGCWFGQMVVDTMGSVGWMACNPNYVPAPARRHVHFTHTAAQLKEHFINFKQAKTRDSVQTFFLNRPAQFNFAD